jgi:hypothetical protein
MSHAFNMRANPSADMIDIFLPPGEYCVGDVGHRQILFDIRNGDLWSRQIAPVFA